MRYLEGQGATACPLSGFESLTGKGIRFREPEGIPAAGENPVFGPDTIPDGRSVSDTVSGVESEEGKTYWIGSRNLLAAYGAAMDDALSRQITSYEQEGRSTVFFGSGTRLLAEAVLSDRSMTTTLAAL